MQIIKPKAQRINDTLIHLSWQSNNPAPVKVYQELLPEKTPEKKQLLAQTRDHCLDVPVPPQQRCYFLLQQEHEQIMVAERVLPLQGANNFRDFGGYITPQGKQVKWGVFYRSDHLNRLTDQDLQYLRSLYLHTIVDYRNLKEYSQQPNRIWDDNIQTWHIIPQAASAELAAKTSNDQDKIQALIQLAQGDHLINGSGAIMEEQNRDFIRNPQVIKCYRQLIDLILEPKNMPMNQHCRGGKDRTGFGAAIILYLLGVSMDDIIEDYMLTGILRAERNQRRMAQYREQTQQKEVLDFLSSMMETRASYLQAAFDEMVKLYGSVDNFMQQALQITATEQQRLKILYLY